MGRWVTSKGRRIYIPDEGEENPYAKNKLERKEGKDPIGNDEDTKEKIKPYYVDQETQILGEKMSSRGKMIYAKSEEEALSQYKKEYPKGNPRIKESKYPEHVKKAEQLNKEESTKQKQIDVNKAQADERNGKKALNPKQQKAAELAKKQLLFDKGYAEITGNHWNMVGMSNEKMVAALNASDSNYTYEYKTEETKGTFGMPNAKVIHHRIYRKKK